MNMEHSCGTLRTNPVFVFPQNAWYTTIKNIRYLAYTCRFYIKDLVKLTCIDIISKVCDEWKDRMTADNLGLAEQVKELVC